MKKLTHEIIEKIEKSNPNPIVNNTPTDEVETQSTCTKSDDININKGCEPEVKMEELNVLKRDIELLREEVSLAHTKSVETVPYMKTREAVKDFADMMIKNKNGGGDSFKNEWKDHLKRKGIENPEVLLPEPIVSEILTFMEMDDFFSRVQMPTIKMYSFAVKVAVQGQEEDARARGHKKGDEKVEQVVKLIKRKIEPQHIYKMLSIDKIVIDMNDTVDIVNEFTTELVEALLSEIKLAICFGDQRDDADPYKISEIRPVFGNELALEVQADGATGMAMSIDDIDRTVLSIRGMNKIMVFARRADLIDLRLQKDLQGRLLMDRGLSVESQLGVSAIYFAEDWFMGAAAAGVDDDITSDTILPDEVEGAVIFAPAAYKLVGDRNMFTYSEKLQTLLVV